MSAAHTPVPVPAAAARAAALVGAAEGIGGRIHWFVSTGSTNDAVLERVAAGDPEGTAVFADHQTHGRGRGHRRWYAPPGEGLLCSVALRRAAGLEHLATGMGALAVADLCREAGVAGEIKWPNDVVIGGRKVCGVLAETRTLAGAAWLVLGIGVNVNSTPATLPEAVAAGATSLLIASGRAEPFDRVALAAGLLARLRAHHARIAGGDAAGFCRDWYGRLALRDQPVVLTRQPGEVRGAVCGLNPDGTFRVAAGARIVNAAYEHLIVIGRED